MPLYEYLVVRQHGISYLSNYFKRSYAYTRYQNKQTVRYLPWKTSTDIMFQAIRLNARVKTSLYQQN